MTANDLPDVLRAHSQLGAQGWHLQQRPDDAPRHAVGYYRHAATGELAYLVAYGSKFVLQPARRAQGDA